MDMIRTQEVACNLCNSADSTFLYEATDRLHGIGGAFCYVWCNQCGLVYMNPQVVPEDIEKLYPTDYAAHLPKGKEGGFAVLSLRDRILKVPVLSSLAKPVINVRIVDSIYRKLNHHSKVLDIGCGSGSFLNSVRNDKGCEVYGVDISGSAVRQAKDSFGLEVFEGNILDAPFRDASFDIITAWWYLEHIANPHPATARISNLLKDGGHCILGIPNFDSLNAEYFKDKWFHLDCPRHLCIWNRSTITKLLRAHGLEVTRIIHDKTPGGLLGSLQYLLFGDNFGPKHRNLIRHSSALWLLLLPLAMMVSLLRKSDIIVVYAKKPL